MIRNIQSGTVDIGFITSAPLANIVLEVGVFGIPFIFEDATHARGGDRRASWLGLPGKIP